MAKHRREKVLVELTDEALTAGQRSLLRHISGFRFNTTCPVLIRSVRDTNQRSSTCLLAAVVVGDLNRCAPGQGGQHQKRKDACSLQRVVEKHLCSLVDHGSEL